MNFVQKNHIELGVKKLLVLDPEEIFMYIFTTPEKLKQHVTSKGVLTEMLNPKTGKKVKARLYCINISKTEPELNEIIADILQSNQPYEENTVICPLKSYTVKTDEETKTFNTENGMMRYCDIITIRDVIMGRHVEKNDEENTENVEEENKGENKGENSLLDCDEENTENTENSLIPINTENRENTQSKPLTTVDFNKYEIKVKDGQMIIYKQ